LVGIRFLVSCPPKRNIKILQRNLKNCGKLRIAASNEYVCNFTAVVSLKSTFRRMKLMLLKPERIAKQPSWLGWWSAWKFEKSIADFHAGKETQWYREVM
jgi:hypothetical protein